MSETHEVPSPDDIVDRTTFAEVLTRLRLSADLSVREVARRTGQRASTLGGWFSGPHLPQRSQRSAFVEVLRTCGVSEAELDVWVRSLERARSAPVPAAPRRGAGPYRGLLTYEPTDSSWFFGREGLTASLVQRVAAAVTGSAPRVVAVVGASGSGKSSVLRAGLIPAVARLGVPGSAGPWTAQLVTPGPDPVRALDDRVSLTWADDGVEARRSPVLLVVDQFEELFSPEIDESTRRAFVDRIFALASPDLDPPTVVVIGMRADFYGVAVGDPLIAAVLQEMQVVVTPMGEQDLRRAIVEPARRAEVAVEPDLVELLLREMGIRANASSHDAGALPLLSHALRSTWERSTGRALSVEDYVAAGGISSAVEQTAEETYGGLTERDRELARRIFTRMVNVDETTGLVTRRRLASTALPGAAPEQAAAVLRPFVDRRLVTAHADSVEISHEALLSTWRRLIEWVDVDRDDLRVQHQLSDATHAWEDGDADPTLLWRGGRLDAAVHLRDIGGRLSPAEEQFVAASAQAAHSEHATQRRQLRRTRQLLAAVAVLAVIASVTTVVAIVAGTAANREGRRARTAELAARSRQVAVEARQLADQDPALAEQLALVAWRTSPTPEARSALLDQSALPLITRVLGGPGPTSLALSADGRTLAVGRGDDGSVRLYRLDDTGIPHAEAVIPGRHDDQVFAVRFSGHLLAVGGTAHVVTLYDVTDAARPRLASTLDMPFTLAVESIAVSPDGTLLAACSAGPDPVRVWDISTPTRPRAVARPRGVPTSAVEQSVVFSPDGTQLLSGGSGGQVFVWPTAALTTATARVVPDGSSTVNTLVFDPAGEHLYTGDRLGAIAVFDAHTLVRQQTHAISTTAWVNALAFSPDGREVASADSDGTVERFEVDGWNHIESVNHPGPVTGIVYSPDGRTVASTAADGALRLWSTGRDVAADTGSSVFSVAYSADGGALLLADTGDRGAARLWDTRDPARPVPASPRLTVTDLSGASAIRPDGTLLAVGTRSGTVRLMDASTPSAPVPVGGGFAAAGALVEWLAFSPDGATLAVGSDDKTVSLWDVTAPAHPVRLAAMTTGNFVVDVVFSPDGRQLAAASVDDHAYLWDVSDLRRPVQQATFGGFASYVYAVAFDPTRHLLAATSADHTTRLWDISTPTAPVASGAPLVGPTGYNFAVSFSPDGRTLAVGSNDHQVWLYDVSDPHAPTVAATLEAVGGSVNALAFSPDGSHVTAGGRSDLVPTWTVDPSTVAQDLCRGAGDAITRSEWSQYVTGADYQPPCG